MIRAGQVQRGFRARAGAFLGTGLVCTAVILLAGSVTRAGPAGDPGLRVDRSARLGIPIFVRRTDGAPLVDAANRAPVGVQAAPGLAAGAITPLDFFRAHPTVFNIADPVAELRLVGQEVDSLGHTHTTYQQLHRGIPVFSGMLKVHQDAAGSILSVNGRYYPIAATKFDATPSIQADAARQVAEAAVPAPDLEMEQADLVVVDPGWYGDSVTGPHLAYHVILRNVNLAVRESLFVDAHTAEVLDRWSMIYDAKNRQIYDGGGTSGIPGTIARAEGQVAVASPEDVNRAYDYYSDVYDYYFRAFGRDSINNAGLAMIATVNSTAPGCPNAYWNGVQMVFCTGTVTDDVVGHELTHGVTQYTAGLIYQNQPGQLNESYSDVFGELIDLFNGDCGFAGPPGGTPWPAHATGPGLDTPNNHRTTGCSKRADGFPDGVRWLMGEDATAFSSEIRDMWNPPCRNHPDRANSALQTCNVNDSGGVHSGSGVPNHAFALITDGGTFNGQTTVGIGPIKAGAVWYRALTVYLTPAADFSDAYLALNQAAVDLIGATPNDPRTGLPSASAFTSADAADVDRGLLATEMHTEGLCGGTDAVLDSTPQSPCPGATVLFSDGFEGGVNGWTVSNTAPPSPYDWVQVTNLPYGRAGKAWFCADPINGNCSSVVEAAVHSLFSPIINVPANATGVRMMFTHYLETEPGFDGGNVKVSVNGGPWATVPRQVFTFNPYNARINTVGQNNDSPMAGENGWTGFGGKWGTSEVDLRTLVVPGGTLRVRFDFGKDGCNGATGWWMDDFSVYNCPDCDGDGNPDQNALVHTDASDPLGNIGSGSPQAFFLGEPPIAAGDVLMTFTTRGDFSATSERIDVDINGIALGSVFAVGGGDCPGTPDREDLVIPAASFNAAVGGGAATMNLTATADVNPGLTQCGGESYVTVFVRYAAAGLDCDASLTPDRCDRAAAGVGGFVAALLGTGPYSCLYDFDTNAVVNGRDIQPYVRSVVGP